jgi:hypothetical protein
MTHEAGNWRGLGALPDRIDDGLDGGSGHQGASYAPGVAGLRPVRTARVA